MRTRLMWLLLLVNVVAYAEDPLAAHLGAQQVANPTVGANTGYGSVDPRTAQQLSQIISNCQVPGGQLSGSGSTGGLGSAVSSAPTIRY